MQDNLLVNDESVFGTQSHQAEMIVKNYMMWTGAAGVIPVPIVDMAAVAAVQVKMLQKIGEVYGYKLPSHWVQSTIGSLTGGIASMGIGKGIGKLVKSIPIVGSIASVIIAPGFAAASTYALGRVFIMHFESGETLLTFNAEKYITHYKALVNSKINPVADKSKADTAAASADSAKAAAAAADAKAAADTAAKAATDSAKTAADQSKAAK